MKKANTTPAPIFIKAAEDIIKTVGTPEKFMEFLREIIYYKDHLLVMRIQSEDDYKDSKFDCTYLLTLCLQYIAEPWLKHSINKTAAGKKQLVQSVARGLERLADYINEDNCQKQMASAWVALALTFGHVSYCPDLLFVFTNGIMALTHISVLVYQIQLLEHEKNKAKEEAA